MLPPSLAILFVAIASAAPPDQPSESEPLEGQIHRAVESSLTFLEKEGVAWMKGQQCASCHHIPFMVWSMNEARNHGYQINEKPLAEVTSWALAEEGQPQVFPDLPLDKKRTEPDYLGPLLMALAVGAGGDRGVAVEEARRRLLAHALTQQEKDGSWHANSGGRPPVHASRDIQTSWLLLAMSDPCAARETQNEWKAELDAAADWLVRNPPADSHQGLTMRLLVSRQLGKPDGDRQGLLESVLGQQKEDGGWSQTRERQSDAFATGLTLYALNQCKTIAVDDAVRRAVAFLIKTQQPDGSWLMSSRPAEPTGPGPAKDLRPIKFVGTAWATIGLVRWHPGPRAGK